MKMSLLSSVFLLLPAMFPVQVFAQSNIERAVVYEINKIRAASCLDSFYYNPEISASCRENALKNYKAGNARIEQNEEQGTKEFTERFLRYLPERYKKRCLLGAHRDKRSGRIKTTVHFINIQNYFSF